jgi:hypothetical protein
MRARAFRRGDSGGGEARKGCSAVVASRDLAGGPGGRAPVVYVPTHAESTTAARLALQRAAFEHARGDFAAVVRTLTPLQLETTRTPADPDRAAFLLAHALLRLGQRERFDRLEARVSTGLRARRSHAGSSPRAGPPAR